jgi:hypothetical protein
MAPRRPPKPRSRGGSARPRPASDGPAHPDEARLLRLARELSVLGRSGTPATALSAALGRLGRRDAGRRDALGGTLRSAEARLALAWAREQVRLALAELLERAARAGAVRTDVPAETLAWLLQAAADALGHEPPEAVPDRLAALAAFIRPGGPPA